MFAMFSKKQKNVFDGLPRPAASGDNNPPLLHRGKKYFFDHHINSYLKVT